MEFTLTHALEVLERTPAVLETLLHGLSDPWVHALEGPDTWSPYDIVGHLIHGEKTDWVPRMQIILSDAADKAFTPYDRFAQFQESQGKSLADLLGEFRVLRQQNTELLRGLELTEAQLGREGIHPAFGRVTLRQLLSTWTVHDLGHIAQISRVMAKQYREAAGPWQAYLPILGS